MDWKVILDTLQFILAKYGPMARQGDLLYHISVHFWEKAEWGTTMQYLKMSSELAHFFTYSIDERKIEVQPSPERARI